MILKSLELENIRSYKKQQILFEKGINFLSGDIGCGKSTILLSIEFALFGFKKGDLEGFHLLRKGEREGSIKLIIENENSLIEIYRKIKRGKSNDIISQENGYLKLDDNLIELAPSEINAYIFEIFNFPKEFLTKDKNLIYRFTVYTAQEQLKEIIFAENEKRLEVIRKIFGIDKYKQLKDAISIYMGKIREDKKLFQIKLEPLANLLDEIIKEELDLELISKTLEEQIKNENLLQDKIKKYEEGILKREELFEKLVEKILLIEKKLSEIEQIEKNCLVLEKEKERKNSLLEESRKIDYIKLDIEINLEIKVQDEKLQKLFSEKKHILEKITALEDLKQEKDKILKLLNEIDTKKQIIQNEEKNLNLNKTVLEIKNLNENLVEIKKIISENESIIFDYEKQKEEYLKLKLELENIQNKINESEKSIQDITKLDKCPTCLQEVSKGHKENLHEKINDENLKYQAKKEKLILTIKLAESNLIKTKAAKEIFEKSTKQLLEFEIKLKNLNETKSNEEKILLNIEKLKKEIDFVKNTNPKIRYDEILLKLTDEKKLRDQIEIFNRNEQEIREQSFNLNSKLKDNVQKSKDIQRISEEISVINKKIEENNSELIKKKLYLDKLYEYKENEKKIKEEKAKLNEVLTGYKKEEKEINIKISSEKTSINMKKKILEDKKEKIKTLEILKSDYQKIIEQENFLSSKAVSIADSIERAIFTKYYAEFCQKFEMFFKELIEDNNIEIRLDDEFSPIVEQNGYDLDIKNLSGGEKSSLAISYRLALKQIIENNISSQKLSLLILDEPTDGFSREQVDRLGNILREIKLEQILIVSHDEKIESISDKVFYIEKINHVSEIK